MMPSPLNCAYKLAVLLSLLARRTLRAVDMTLAVLLSLLATRTLRAVDLTGVSATCLASKVIAAEVFAAY